MAESQTKEAATSEQHRPDSPSSSPSTEKEPKDATGYPPFARVLATLGGVFICGFLVALDRTIVGTAIPKITDEFHSLGDVGWYASAYLLTLCGFQLLFGRIFTFFNVKIMYLTVIFIFEIGSAICGAAPNSPVFIFGRAIAGIGASGIFSGAIPIFMRVLPLHKRPMWTAMFGLVFGVSSIVAPLIGGGFTDGVTWRWCFYINLPLGAVAFIVIMITLHVPPTKKVEGTTWMGQLNKLDPIGTVVFFSCITCLLLALQWGGVTYAWSNARIIALLVLFGVLLVAFAGVQLWRQDLGTIPPRILNNRSMIGCLFFQFCLGAAQFIMIYFLPIWFQAIKGVSAFKSGIMNIPLMLAFVIGTVSGGLITTKIGYYVPVMYMASILTPIGAGLISTFTVTTGRSKWIGYQVIFGLGMGLGIQQPAVTAQTVLAAKDVPTGVALTFFIQTLAGAMFTSIADTVFGNKFSQGLTSIPGVDVSTVAHKGATDLRNSVKPSALPAVLMAYNAAVVQAFFVAVAMSSMFILGTILVQWRSIKKGKHVPPQEKVASSAAPEPQEEKQIEKSNV